MADDDIRDDGTVICAIHGMRYDPALTEGCIRCPRSVMPGKRSAAPPRSVAPKSVAPRSAAPAARSVAPGSVGPPPPGYRSAVPGRPTTPPIPFEPAYLGSSPYQQPQQQSGPQITIMAGPKQRTSRRGLVGFLGLLIAGGAGTAAWLLRPEGATDWSKKITTFRYGPSAALTGALYIPTAAAERACPLLLLLDHNKKPARICTRFAKHCEELGWIAASCDAFGGPPSKSDNDDAALFLDAVRANANVDGGRPVVGGFDSGGEAACRLALLEPNVFSGAILECCPTGAWRDLGAMARNDTAFFIFTRTEDTGREATRTMKDEMQRKGLRVTYDELPGGHVPMERDELDPAFAWLATMRG